MFCFWGCMVLSGFLGPLCLTCYLKPHLCTNYLLSASFHDGWNCLSLAPHPQDSCLPFIYVSFEHYMSFRSQDTLPICLMPNYLSPEERMSIGKWWHFNSVMCKWEERDYITCLSHFFKPLLSKYWTMTLKPKKASLCKGHSGHVAGLMTPTSVMECNQRLACFDYPVFFFSPRNRCLVEVFLIFFQSQPFSLEIILCAFY